MEKCFRLQRVALHSHSTDRQSRKATFEPSLPQRLSHALLPVNRQPETLILNGVFELITATQAAPAVTSK